MSVDLSQLKDELTLLQGELTKEQHNWNWGLLRQWGVSNQTDLETLVSSLKTRIENAVGVDSSTEIISARTNADGTTFSNLKARLDDDDKNALHVGEQAGTIDEAKTIRILDISTSSSKIKYTVEETLNTDCNPRSQGLVITKLVHISVLEQS